MKKHLLISILVFAAALAAGYFLLQKEKPGELPSLECAKNSDCKLIYGNCACASVPLSDKRTELESDVVCIWNSCHGLNVTAVCKNNKCITSRE